MDDEPPGPAPAPKGRKRPRRAPPAKEATENRGNGGDPGETGPAHDGQDAAAADAPGGTTKPPGAQPKLSGAAAPTPEAFVRCPGGPCQGRAWGKSEGAR